MILRSVAHGPHIGKPLYQAKYGGYIDPLSRFFMCLSLFIRVIMWGVYCFSLNIRWNSNTLATWCEELTHLKRPDAGKDWRQKRTTNDEMVAWHHWLNGHDFEEALGVGDGQGSLSCCSPWGDKESDMTELNWDLCLPNICSLWLSISLLIRIPVILN